MQPHHATVLCSASNLKDPQKTSRRQKLSPGSASPLITHHSAFEMSKSRKRVADDGPSTADRKGKKRKSNADKDDSLDMELGINTAFARLDNQLLADHLLQKLTRFGADLSSVEVSDMTIPGKSNLPSERGFGVLVRLTDVVSRSQCDQGHHIMARAQDHGEITRFSREVHR